MVLYDYDAVGRVKRMFNGSGAPVYLESLKYDIFGRPLTIAHGNGAVDARTYATTAAERYRLTRIRADAGGTPLFNYGYGSYTATGLLGSRTDDGWVSGQPPMMKGHGTYSYDGVGRLTQVSDTVGTRGYSHDEWGNLKTKEGVTFTYGEAAHPHRVTSFTGSGSGLVEHDENGNRLGRDAGGGWTEQAYRYDPEDRLERITVGPDAPSSPAVEFDYDYSGRRTRERRGTVQANDSVAAQELANYYSDVFEVRGDRARKYYIAGGLLVASRDVPAPATLQVASAGGGAVQVATVWQAGSPTVAFTLSGSAPSAAIAVLASGGVIWLLLPGRRRRFGLGLRLRTADVVLVAVVSLSSAAPWPFLVQPAYAQKTGPTPTPTAVPPAEVHHYHLDHLGSPQTVTDGYGTIVEQVRYDPYGAVRDRWKPIGGVYNNTGLTEQDRREFTGYQTEPLSELNYANARFYDPDFATFLTHDPAREFASPYTYTGWDPINVTDPSGACVWDLCLGEILTAVAIGAAAGFAATRFRPPSTARRSATSSKPVRSGNQRRAWSCARWFIRRNGIGKTRIAGVRRGELFG